MRHPIATLGCACNQAGNTALVDQILSGMEASGRNTGMFAKKRAKKNALSTLVGKAKERAKAIVSGPESTAQAASTVGAVGGGRAITTGSNAPRSSGTIGVPTMGEYAVGGGRLLAGAALYVGTGAALGAGVAAIVAPSKPEYKKGALIGGAAIVALGLLGAMPPLR